MVQPQKQRNRDIDILKAILVIGMIFRHVIMLLGSEHSRNSMESFLFIIDLTSYSGFLFCFGYTTWLSYLSRNMSFKRVFPSIARPLIVYYISGFFYLWFVQLRHSEAAFIKVLTIPRLVPDSEFLLAFALTLLAGFLLKKPIQSIVERPRIFFIVIAVLLLGNFIPNYTNSIPLSLFIGAQLGKAKYTFPLLQYFPIYLIGIYFARYKIRPNLWIGLAGIGIFYLFKSNLHVSRFPPNLAWIATSMFFVLTWYALTSFISQWKVLDALISIGSNSLLYLLTSNIMIFAIQGQITGEDHTLNLRTSISIFLMILAITYFITTIVRNVGTKKEEPTTLPESV